MVIGAVNESEEQRSIPAHADKLFYFLLGAGGGEGVARRAGTNHFRGEGVIRRAGTKECDI